MASLHTVVIFNPGSGTGRLSEEVLALAPRPEIEIWPLEPGEDPGRQTAEACRRGATRVVAAGGDGTVSAVVNGLLQVPRARRPTLAVLPCGSANDFAKALGFGPDWERALAALEDGEEREIDVVRVTGGQAPALINAATGGLSVEINEEMDANTKRWWGGYAYARTALEVVPRAETYRVEIDADGARIAGEMTAVILGNGGFAGGVCLLPPADLGDGLLDLATVGSVTLGERAGLLAQFALGRHLESELVDHRRARRVHVESDPPMPFIGDGELLGETPLTFEVEPAALRALVAREPRK